MKLYRPTVWGWWLVQVITSLAICWFLPLPWAPIMFFVGGLVSGLMFLINANTSDEAIRRRTFFPQMWAAVEHPTPPDPIAQMASFKAKRRREEIKAWDAAYCDALGFHEREAWHRASAIEKARKGEPYWSPKPNDPPIQMKTRRAT